MTADTVRRQEARIFVGCALRLLGHDHPQARALVQVFHELGGIWRWVPAVAEGDAPPPAADRTLDDIVDEARGRWK